jgi:NTE family protein
LCTNRARNQAVTAIRECLSTALLDSTHPHPHIERAMDRKRIAIACQGGGSQCAFVAGALNALLSDGVQHRYRIVGLSGTSGGAITAALGWIGLLKQAHGDPAPVGKGIIDCWKDLSARTPIEIGVDAFGVMMLRLVEHGVLPSVANSPSSPRFQLMTQAIAKMIGRPEFTDLRALLVKHVDFPALPALVEPDSPVLLLGASDVLEGHFKVFSSMRGEISVDALLASAAIPNLFPAVWVDGHAYWDGIFSQNPPVMSFLRQVMIGKGKIPNEIWVIQVNRTEVDSVPEWPSDIFDRRNHLAGNLSLQHELEMINLVNLLIQEGALTEQVRARFGVDLTEPIAVRFIRMSEDLQKGLDYPSKLSRQPTFIDRLIDDGARQASAFLAKLGDSDRPLDAAALPVVESVEGSSSPRPA